MDVDKLSRKNSIVEEDSFEEEENSIVEEAMKTRENIGIGIQFEEGGIWIDRGQINGGWKPAWRRMKEKLN